MNLHIAMHNLQVKGEHQLSSLGSISYDLQTVVRLYELKYEGNEVQLSHISNACLKYLQFPAECPPV